MWIFPAVEQLLVATLILVYQCIRDINKLHPFLRRFSLFNWLILHFITVPYYSVMRLYFIILSLPLLASCSLLRPGGLAGKTSPMSMAQAIDHNRKPRKFLDDISVTPEKTRVTFVAQVDQGNASAKGGPLANTTNNEFSSITANKDRARSIDPSRLTGLQRKYAELMNVEAESLPSLSLLLALEEWYGTPYLWGGSSRSGVDCSAFTQAIYQAVYGVTLPRVSRDQHSRTRRIGITELQEGDLVFFNTRGRGVSHVGVYLGNHKFAHASSHKGVMVSDLYENYYAKRYLGAGRWE
jgi:lipoprotein Spr